MSTVRSPYPWWYSKPRKELFEALLWMPFCAWGISIMLALPMVITQSSLAALVYVGLILVFVAVEAVVMWHLLRKADVPGKEGWVYVSSTAPTALLLIGAVPPCEVSMLVGFFVFLIAQSSVAATWYFQLVHMPPIRAEVDGWRGYAERIICGTSKATAFLDGNIVAEDQPTEAPKEPDPEREESIRAILNSEKTHELKVAEIEQLMGAES